MKIKIEMKMREKEMMKMKEEVIIIHIISKSVKKKLIKNLKIEKLFHQKIMQL